MTNSDLLESTASSGTRAALEQAAADAAVRGIPGTPLMAQVHTGGAVSLASAVVRTGATYVGSRSAEFALVLLDDTELAAAGGDAGRVRVADVLRPALEAAGATLGDGLLGESSEQVEALFASPEAAIFDLVGESGAAGWFAVAVRLRETTRRAPEDVAARLPRINNVEMTLAVEIGRAQVSVRELLAAKPGTVIELDRAVGADADLYLNGRLIAHGAIVVIDQQFGVKITEVLDLVDET